MPPKSQIAGGGPRPPASASPQALMQSSAKQPGVVPPKVPGTAMPSKPVATAALQNDWNDWSDWNDWNDWDEWAEWLGGWANGDGWDSWDDGSAGHSKGKDGKGKDAGKDASKDAGKGKDGKGKDGKGKDGKGRRGKGRGKNKDDFEVVVKGLPSTTDEATLQAFFSSCGEITRVSIPRAKDGLPKGAAFVGFTTEEGVKNALVHDKSLYMGSICISVRPASEKHEGGGKKRSNDDLTIVIKGFPEHADEASLSAFFSSCGDWTVPDNNL